jgi:DNA-binding NarL/FixJ family response regulator
MNWGRALKKLLLVDDHQLVRESLAWLLPQRLPGLVVRDAGTLSEAMALFEQDRTIDGVVLDLDLPDSRGLATLQRWREAYPDRPVFVLSAKDDAQTVLAALDEGAAGFVPKTADVHRLLTMLQRVTAGELVLPDGPMFRSRSDEPPLPLTPRQRDMLRLLIAGRSNKAIGRELGLSEATVKTHIQALYRKLGVNTRTQAVLAVARRGQH